MLSVRSAWVFNVESFSVAGCVDNCANRCGRFVQDEADFRGGVFGSAGNSRTTIILLLDCFASLAMTKNLNRSRHPGGYRDPAAKGGLLTSLLTQTGYRPASV